MAAKLNHPKLHTATGGASRQDTVANGLEFLAQRAAADDWVLVHDAARPCLSGAEIKAFSHLEGATVASGALVGPYARLRPGADIGEDAHIGNFVEVKNARIEKGAKANHLSYLGDARVGEGANIGAGTITCNYDGFDKYHTDIGAGAFIGSNSALVAPVKIADGVYVGAGSVITKAMSKDSLAVTRAEQKEIPGWADKFRQKKRAETAARKKGK